MGCVRTRGMDRDIAPVDNDSFDPTSIMAPCTGPLRHTVAQYRLGHTFFRCGIGSFESAI
jgi:hypothetical protein